MDCSHRKPPSGTPVTQNKPHRSHHARSSSRHHSDDRDRQSQSRSHSHYRKHYSLSHHDSHRCHSKSQTRIDAATTGAAHNNLTQPIETTAIDLTATHHTDHIADHPHIEALQVIDPEITVDHIHDHPIDLQAMNLADQIHILAGQEEDHIP